MADIDEEIDRLYQGALDGFVAARNALARSARRPDLKQLEKPSAPAWAVNQLYWRSRPLFDRVVAAAEAVREAHASQLSGRAADVAGAEAAHREAVREAVAAARQHLVEAGQPPTAATLDAVSRTCQALPSSDAPGRLTRPLAPAGLEALAGLAIQALRPAPAPGASPSAAGPPTAPRPPADFESARQARARQARREAAEHAVANAEAKLAAADRAVAQADMALAEARAVVVTAERTLGERRIARDMAAAAVDAARLALTDPDQ
ncbi:MAG: hypothetical protein R2745_22250 [Vicinamibacterales bacterium]